MHSDNNCAVHVTVEADGWRAVVADPEKFCCKVAALALDAAVGPVERPIELGLRLADDATVRALNRDWRGRDAATNVLSFPSDERPADLPIGAPWLVGDVVLALETVLDEAAAGPRPVPDHLAHLVVHGVLHLLGHDHADDVEAQRMEGLETLLLARMGVPDPYTEGGP